ncbi:MAG: HAD family hydrolase [Clostridium sp.]
MHINTKTRLLIFYMDGLLVDTERVYMEGWLYALKKLHIAVSEPVVRSWVGKSFHETGAYLMQVCHEEAVIANIRKAREQYIYQCLQYGSLHAMTYELDALQAAREYGYRTGLATSSLKKRSTAILAHLGLLSYLDIPVFADDVTKLKPHPDLYLEVLRRAQVPCEHAAAFEDSLTGVQAAVAAGIQTVRIPDRRFIDVEDTASDVDCAENLSCVRAMLEQLNT